MPPATVNNGCKHFRKSGHGIDSPLIADDVSSASVKLAGALDVTGSFTAATEKVKVWLVTVLPAASVTEKPKDPVGLSLPSWDQR